MKRVTIGAICGGILFGMLSEQYGRRRCVVAGPVAVIITVLAVLGTEARGVLFARAAA